MTTGEIDADLFDAVELGNLEDARVLLQRPQTDIDAQDRRGQTVLMLAASYGLTDMVRLLLTFTPDIAISDRLGQTAIDIARNEQHFELVRILERARGA